MAGLPPAVPLNVMPGLGGLGALPFQGQQLKPLVQRESPGSRSAGWLPPVGPFRTFSACARITTAACLTSSSASQAFRVCAQVMNLGTQSGIARTLADPATPVSHQTLDGFERWLRTNLDVITNTDQQRLVARFTSWHVLNRLRHFAARSPLSQKQIGQAGP